MVKQELTYFTLP